VISRFTYYFFNAELRYDRNAKLLLLQKDPMFSRYEFKP
jgi:hypothetical protein